MAIVIHTISGKQYAYEHTRVGNRIKTTYLYPVGKEGAKRPTDYKPGEGRRFKQHKKPEPANPLPMKRVYGTEGEHSYNETLFFSKVLGLGNTALYAGEKVSKESLAMVEKVFNALPVYAQKGIDYIELFGESTGENFKVGDNDFSEGGHWSLSEKTMRAFNGWSKHIESSAVGVYWHESGHNVWSKLEKLLDKEERTLIQSWVADKKPVLMALRDEAEKGFIDYANKWEIEKEKLTNKRSDLRLDSLGLDKEIQNKMNAEADKIQEKIDAEEDKINKMRWSVRGAHDLGGHYDPDYHLRIWLAEQERPVKRLLNKFWDVTESEGGLTSYSQAYVKSDSSNAANENFAEAFKHWMPKAVGLSDNPYTFGKNNLPGKTTDWEQEYETNFEFKSRTKAAFMDIIETLTPLLLDEV